MAESSEASQTDAQTKAEGASGPLSFTLNVVSPSVGVSGPLNFSKLPATTTVKELKTRIRDVLPSKPQDENQRLIHRGRMLGRETETMLDIFGQETLSNTESQTLHLVLRPTAPEAVSHPATSTPTPIPQHAIANPPIPPHFQPRPQSTPVNPIQAMHGGIHGMQAQQPLPGFQQHFQNQQHQLNQHHVAHFQQGMVHRLGQLQQETQRLQQEINLFEQRARAAATAIQNGQQAPPVGPGIPPQSIFRPAPPPPSFHQLINQQQRERAAEGRQGAQDTGGLPHIGQFPQTASGRASPSTHRPDSTTTYTREGVGPNGERWSVTVNETTTTIPIPQSQPHHHHPAPHANPALDIQAVLRNADRFLAQNGQNNMQRSASNPTSSQAPTSAPGINRPETPGQATPTTTNSSPSTSTILNPLLNPNLPVTSAPTETTTGASSSSSSNQPMVYLLSSPSGPRALLVTNSETYFTPRHSSRRRLSPTTTLQGQTPGGVVALPEYRNRIERAARRNAQPDPVQAAPQVLPNALHGNPPAGAIGAQVGPIIWLLARLAFFIWFFTSGNPSWTRWFIMVGLGFLVLLYNTGVLNGIGNDIFGPIRRHLENLIPLAGPEAALVPAQNAAPIPQVPAREAPAGNLTPQQRQRGELDPAEAAERILEQRRQRLANGGWLVAQIRRAEHSLLLFLASLVPGVGERHIAAREAEANAAEARRLEAIAAAEAAEQAANAANAENAEASGNGGVEGTEGTGEQRESDTNEAQNNNTAAAPPAQPLIEV
ncbi:hypothetical protein IFR05_000432 [Cadophora sp. M221]|nr:hypothetical protein IFR05_000432 [Cadophora sp. M221]